MGISSYIREKKRQVQAARNAKKSREAWERQNPDAALKQLREEAKEREQLREVKRLKSEARKEKFAAVAGFFAGPTMERAKKEGRVKVKGYQSQPNSAFSLGSSGVNSAFGLGSSRDSYNLNRPSVFGLGGKANPAFGLGPTRKPSAPKRKKKRVIAYIYKNGKYTGQKMYE